MSKPKSKELETLDESANKPSLSKKSTHKSLIKPRSQTFTIQSKPEAGNKTSITYRSKRSLRSKQTLKDTNSETIAEISVNQMNIHRLPSTRSLVYMPKMSRPSGLPQHPSTSTVRVQKASQARKSASKQKLKTPPKPTAQVMYTNRAIQQIKPKKVDTGTSIQYRPRVIQQNIRSVRKEMQSKQLVKSRDSDTSIVSMMDFSISSAYSKSRRRHRKVSKTPIKRRVVVHDIQTISSVAKMQDAVAAQRTSTPLTQSISFSSKKSSISRRVNSPSIKKSSKARSISKRKQSTDHQICLINHSLEQFRRFQVAGVRALGLTDSTQDVLGIKGKINLESPWFHLRIDAILDKVQQVHTYSETLKVLEVIVPYVGEDILVGYFPYPNMFLVCTTPEAKNQVIAMIEEDLIKGYEMLESKLCRSPFRWMSFGSETEIDEENFCLRPLLRTFISLIYPIIHEETTRFKMRLVQDARDGYVELLPERDTFNIVYRKKVDASSQVVPSNISVGTQIGNKLLKIIGTQYCYTFKEQHLTTQQNMKLNMFLKDEYKNIEATLQQNIFMQIHLNDYKNLRPHLFHIPESPKELLQFWEPKYCKNKIVSLVVWNPWKSGNIAVVYSETNTIVQKENLARTNLAEQNYVLIWDYANNNKPEQYLFSEQVITTVTFSPQDQRMVIGGCETGSILIWYLLDAEFEAHEESLTEKARKYRDLMNTMSSWIKNLYETRNITKPVAFSSAKGSHLGQVNCIKWMLPKYKFSLDAQLLTVGKDEEVFQQFLSCGVDGHVFIWDVPKLNLTGPTKVGSKMHRYANILRGKTLAPRCKIKISLSTPNCLVFMQIPNQMVTFDVVQFLADKVLFASREDPANKIYSPNVYLSTYFGAVVKATWDKYEVHLTEKHGTLTVSPIIHDGPVSSFEIHPVDSDLVLTVGGKIFAVWFLPNLQKPVFWRKRHTELVAGFWSLANAEELTVATNDAQLETWNFVEHAPYPIVTRNTSKYPIATLFNDVSSQHAHKNTLTTTDNMGSVKVVTVPEDAPPKRLMQRIIRLELQQKVQNIFDIRQKLKETLCPEQTAEAAEVAEEPETAKYQIRKTEVFRIKKGMKVSQELRREQRVVKWKERDLQNKIEMLKENYFQAPGRKIDQYLKDEKGFKENLPCLKENQEKRERMLKAKVTTRNSFISRSVDNILSRDSVTTPKKVVDIRIPTGDRAVMKRKYLAEYENMEKPTVSFIKWNPYDEELNWMDFIDKRRRKYSLPIRSRRSSQTDSSSTVD